VPPDILTDEEIESVMRAISRRRLLNRYLPATVSGAYFGAQALDAFPFTLPLGVQGYDVQPLEFKDMEGTWKKLAAFGYQFVDFMSTTSARGVPPAIAAMTGKQLRESLGAAGLSAPNAFFTLAEFRDSYD